MATKDVAVFDGTGWVSISGGDGAAVALFVTLLATLAVGATAIIFRLLTSRAALYLLVGIVIRNECTVVWWHIRNLFLLG